MKKQFFAIAFFASVYSLSVNAQKTKPDPCEGLKEIYDAAIYRLDSIMGAQIELQKQLKSTQQENFKHKTEIQSLLKSKNEAKADLESAKKLLSEQAEKIKALEAEVKRLSPPIKSSVKKNEAGNS